ncbi:MAG: integrase core domain-containing protein [bacterium]
MAERQPTDTRSSSSNGRLRDEHLNTGLFFSAADRRTKILEWQRAYNEVRPQNSLGQIPPCDCGRVAVNPGRTRRIP